MPSQKKQKNTHARLSKDQVLQTFHRLHENTVIPPPKFEFGDRVIITNKGVVDFCHSNNYALTGTVVGSGWCIPHNMHKYSVFWDDSMNEECSRFWEDEYCIKFMSDHEWEESMLELLPSVALSKEVNG